MDAITDAYGGDVLMIDGMSVRVHHSAATLKKATRIAILDEAGEVLLQKIHALTDDDGLPLKLVITPGQTHDIKAATELLSDIRKGQMVLADRAYDADWLHNMVSEQGGWANIPPKTNRKTPICYSPWLYKQRNLVERFFNSAAANDPGDLWASQMLSQDRNPL